RDILCFCMWLGVCGQNLLGGASPLRLPPQGAEMELRQLGSRLPSKGLGSHLVATAALVVADAPLLAIYQRICGVGVWIQRPRPGGMENGGTLQPVVLQ